MKSSSQNSRVAVYGALFVGVLALVMGLTACKVEIGRSNGSPTPTPSPSPSPVVISASIPAYAASASTSPDGNVGALQVASANAALLQSATTDATTQVKRFSAAVRRASIAPATAGQELPVAEASLAAARAAYLKAEACVFYADPDSAAELTALPDPLGVGSVSGEAGSFADLAARLDALAAAADGDIDAAALVAAQAALADLSSRSEALQAQMESLAEAWSDEPGSFRQRYFLSNSGGAVARIFQGLLALSGDVIPEHSLGGAAPADDVAGRVDALAALYTGGDGPGLDDLVNAASPDEAAAMRVSLDRASALAQSLRYAPDNENVREQLRVALEEVTRGLTDSAGKLGIRILDTDSAK